MTLTDLASIGTLIGGAAVLVSLIYLNLQTRQSVRIQQSLIHHGRAELLGDWLQYAAQPEIADTIIRGNDGDQSLSVVEFARYTNILWSGLIYHENNFLQHRAGMLTDEQFTATLGALQFQCALPGFRAFWRQSHKAFEKHFAASVDRLMRATPVRLNASANGHSLWKAYVAQECSRAGMQAESQTDDG